MDEENLRRFIDCVKAADLCPVIPVSMDFLTRPELIERWRSKDIINAEELRKIQAWRTP
jgi:hypothetical protein